MNKIVEINGQELTKIVYRGEPVITFPMTAELHDRTLKSVHNNFERSLERFTESRDYFTVPYEEWKDILRPSKRGTQSDLVTTNCRLQDELKRTNCSFQTSSMTPPKPDTQRGGYRGDMIFLTQIGYLKLVKTFNDDLAWDIYIQLVEHYFNTRPSIGNPNQPTPEYREWMKEQRLFMAEERKFYECVCGAADNLIKNGGSLERLSYVPMLQNAVRNQIQNDPRSKQLDLF